MRPDATRPDHRVERYEAADPVVLRIEQDKGHKDVPLKPLICGGLSECKNQPDGEVYRYETATPGKSLALDTGLPSALAFGSATGAWMAASSLAAAINMSGSLAERPMMMSVLATPALVWPAAIWAARHLGLIFGKGFHGKRGRQQQGGGGNGDQGCFHGVLRVMDSCSDWRAGKPGKADNRFADLPAPT